MTEDARPVWRIEGADRETGDAVTLRVRARDLATAEAAAARRGVLITEVRREGPDRTPSPERPTDPASPVPVEATVAEAKKRADLDPRGCATLLAAAALIGLTFWCCGVPWRNLGSRPAPPEPPLATDVARPAPAPAVERASRPWNPAPPLSREERRHTGVSWVRVSGIYTSIADTVTTTGEEQGETVRTVRRPRFGFVLTGRGDADDLSSVSIELTLSGDDRAKDYVSGWQSSQAETILWLCLSGEERVIRHWLTNAVRDATEGARRDPTRFAEAEPWRRDGLATLLYASHDPAAKVTTVTVEVVPERAVPAGR